MNWRNLATPAHDKILQAASELPPGSATEGTDSRLKISVIFTSMELTRAALKRAVMFVGSLRAGITLVVPQVVPYPLSLRNPPVQLEWNEKRLARMAMESGADHVCIYLCRDRLQTLKSVLNFSSVVVIGCRKAWFAPEWRLARALQLQGFVVIPTVPD